VSFEGNDESEKRYFGDIICEKVNVASKFKKKS
jgi:hypothetical protein